MELLQQNLPQTLMVAGIAALIIEVAVLGFATFILLFFGASLLITGFAMSLDLLPATATAALWSNTYWLWRCGNPCNGCRTKYRRTASEATLPASHLCWKRMSMVPGKPSTPIPVFAGN